MFWLDDILVGLCMVSAKRSEMFDERLKGKERRIGGEVWQKRKYNEPELELSLELLANAFKSSPGIEPWTLGKRLSPSPFPSIFCLKKKTSYVLHWRHDELWSLEHDEFAWSYKPVWMPSVYNSLALVLFRRTICTLYVCRAGKIRSPSRHLRPKNSFGDQIIGRGGQFGD